jgi:hypothetical protein
MDEDGDGGAHGGERGDDGSLGFAGKYKDKEHYIGCAKSLRLWDISQFAASESDEEPLVRVSECSVNSFSLALNT